MDATPVTAPSVASANAPCNPHFERIGGIEVITQLVERFYHHMKTLPEAATIRALHPADLGPVKRVLVNFLTEWMGGPQAYSVERGHPRLRRKHLPFPIGAAERDAWMLCMQRALAVQPYGNELKDYLLAALSIPAERVRQVNAGEI